MSGREPLRLPGRLAGYNRIVIKIGSSLLVDPETGLKSGWLQSLCDDVGGLRASGHEVLIVSSGAIALGRRLLGLKTGSLKLEESQAAAASGRFRWRVRIPKRSVSMA